MRTREKSVKKQITLAVAVALVLTTGTAYADPSVTPSVETTQTQSLLPATSPSKATSASTADTSTPDGTASKLKLPTQEEYDASKKEVAKLAQGIEELRFSMTSLNEKIDVSNHLTKKLNEEFARTSAEFDEANTAYNRRLVTIYKTDERSPGYLFSSQNVSTFFSKLKYLEEVVLSDNDMIRDLSGRRKRLDSAKDKARLENDRLQGMKKELERSNQELSDRLRDANAKLAGMTTVLEAACKEASQRIEVANLTLETPIGSKPTLKEATVLPYSDTKYLVESRMADTFETTGIKLQGVASWYGNEFNGRHAANGEIFNEECFTAASKELPFGTLLAVTYNGKRIIVRINDRGPFIEGRILDLSKGAARALGLGLGEVTAEIVVPAAKVPQI